MIPLGHAAGSGREGVGLVDDEQGAVRPGDLADRVEVARVRQDDPDVGQRRLHEDRGDVAVGELLLQALDVVELGDPAGHRHVDG